MSNQNVETVSSGADRAKVAAAVCAVVAGIVAIILADSVLGVFFYTLGI